MQPAGTGSERIFGAAFCYHLALPYSVALKPPTTSPGRLEQRETTWQYFHKTTVPTSRRTPCHQKKKDKCNPAIMVTCAPPSVYQASRCSVVYGKMGHVHTMQQPSKGKPWTSIATLDFIHKVDLVLPKSCFEVIRPKLVDSNQHPHCFRVIMALGDILSKEFLTGYIKGGEKSSSIQKH
jgi:hypothetical protein